MVQKGQDFLFPTGLGNKEVEIESVDDDAVTLSNALFSDSLSTVDGERYKYSTSDLRDEIDPREVHENRSETARQTDSGQDAPLTTDPLQWASDPSGYDFPGVDTGPTFRESEGDDFDTDSFLENL
jgi:hypothetical protein